MIKHTNYDEIDEHTEKPYLLPERIDTFQVMHDGGRLGIDINGSTVFYEMSGTRDCIVVLDREVEAGPSPAAQSEALSTEPPAPRQFYAPDPFTKYANGRSGQLLVVPAADYKALEQENAALRARLAKLEATS